MNVIQQALESLEYTTNLSRFFLDGDSDIGPMLKAEETIEALRSVLASATVVSDGTPTTEDQNYKVRLDRLVSHLQEEPLDKTLEVGTHDWPHGPQSRDQVIIGRLRKKIKRLIKQREHHKQQHEHYATVISIQPHLESRYNRYTEYKEEQARAKEMEQRLKEQEMLIRLLTGEKVEKWKIDAMYSELIKKEHQRLNVKVNVDRKSTRLNSSHTDISRMPSSA